MNHMDEVQVAHETVIPESWHLDVEPELETVSTTGEQIETATNAERVSLRPEAEAPPSLESILEAVFFAAREPLSVEFICSLIRRIDSHAVLASIRNLNHRYQSQNRPYAIIREKETYRLTLHQRHRHILEWLYGGVKEARLSQQAIETLSIIAYRQPLTHFEIEGILGQPCLTPLRQLIRRGMVSVQGYNDEKESLYVTTQRFLEFFHLSKIDDLPRADDLERL
ncbi:MAG: SMC-Scp complex subunit ScpB [Planctomycetia bacterium]|nr:SMC-Scp complex subunit ScpB [Planctomycetia bacterium]